MRSVLSVLLAVALLAASACAFGGIVAPSSSSSSSSVRRPAFSSFSTSLYMSDGGGGGGGGGGGMDLSKSKKKGLSTIVIDKTEAKMEDEEKKEEQWRLVLHNDEVNTFQHVQRALCTVVTTLDRKRAFDICMETHGIGKATITKVWRQKAEQYCLNLQRQGLTVSIAPDKAFSGGNADMS
eukprot:CAMPEP_0113557706 /NCGR_PEP_ID=MMETSP0015_2-20120614/17940_1 /TAXON_ID=2838 /ORGANISM="Odontella" /LENGTH=180 /DNA_ID=CAMNT_0000459161 /DNA_START=100 /DNA_END=642 /DNA_ORIENTATION=- /assembly_acc=CAM_ASM_000160